MTAISISVTFTKKSQENSIAAATLVLLLAVCFCVFYVIQCNLFFSVIDVFKTLTAILEGEKKKTLI